MSDYFHKVKHLADTMAAIKQLLQEEEIATYMLARLGSEFDTSISTRVDQITLTDQYAHLLNYEMRLEHNTTKFHMTANNVVRSNQGGRPNPRGRGRGRGYIRNNSYNNNHRGSQNSNTENITC